MKRFLIITIAALVFAATAAVQGAAAQSDQQQSVVDVARQAQKQKAKTPAHRTFTNDDLPHNTAVNVSGSTTADEDADKPKSDDASDSTKDPAAKDGKA